LRKKNLKKRKGNLLSPPGRRRKGRSLKRKGRGKKGKDKSPFKGGKRSLLIVINLF